MKCKICDFENNPKEKLATIMIKNTLFKNKIKTTSIFLEENSV